MLIRALLYTNMAMTESGTHAMGDNHHKHVRTPANTNGHRTVKINSIYSNWQEKELVLGKSTSPDGKL